LEGASVKEEEEEEEDAKSMIPFLVSSAHKSDVSHMVLA
jgi:hypothetical protein